MSRGLLLSCLLGLVVGVVSGLRPIRESDAATAGAASVTSWANEQFYSRRDDNEPNTYSNWNITGTYRGTWKFTENGNGSSRYSYFGKTNGVAVLELVSSQSKISAVHLVQGVAIFHDVSGNVNDVGVARMRVEGVYIWPFRQLRLVINGGTDGEMDQEDDYFLSHPYHLLGVFSSQLFQESSGDMFQRRKKSPTYEIEKHCNLDISAKVSQISSNMNGGDHERYHLEGLMESFSVDDDGECFSPMQLNATSLNIEVYYNKAVNYTLMVTFLSFLQVLMLIRQMEHSNTQSGAAKVSILMIGQQAIMDAYLCLLHLTAGILVESLFNAFATAAFFKFVVFSIFEMRYLLAIWKATRPTNTGEGWETVRRDLSMLYSRFYGILLGGILVIYELHNFLHTILFVMYSFWIPQIVFNVMYDTRKPLHPYYIVGMSFTRLAIPLYLFGCPSNFMRIKVDQSFCKFLGAFLGLQAVILLLQHYLGSRWFIPRQILPERYSYCRKSENDANQTIDCVICMTTIDLTRSNEYMVTPCDHYFHSGCLQRWMDIKMECPTCRRPLPPA